jgi:hypothetical protein
MAEYYVVRDKNTGLYFRGKGVNRWGKHYNQASIYRIKANAENTIKEVSWRGEQAEIVPIQIVETTEDVVPKSEVEKLQQVLDLNCENCICLARKMLDEETVREIEILRVRHLKRIDEAKQEVAREIFEEIEKNSKFTVQLVEAMEFDSEEIRKAKLECYRDCLRYFQKLKKKYTESEDKV